jgi:hypothetical protein
LNIKVTGYDFNAGKAFVDIPTATSYGPKDAMFTLTDSKLGSKECPIPKRIIDCGAGSYSCIEPKIAIGIKD